MVGAKQCMKDTFKFDRERYREELKGYDEEQLTKKYNSKTVRSMSFSITSGAGFGLAAVTFGASVVPGIYGARRAYVMAVKQKLIEEEFEARQLNPPSWRGKDVAAGVAIGALSGGLALALPMVGEHVGGAAVQGMMATSSHIDPSMAVSHAGSLVEGLKTGVEATVDNQTATIANHAAQWGLQTMPFGDPGEIAALHAGERIATGAVIAAESTLISAATTGTAGKAAGCALGYNTVGKPNKSTRKTQ